MRQGGSIAEQTGRTFESAVEGLISNAGYELIEDFGLAHDLLVGKAKKKWYCKQYNKLESIYKTPYRIDFVVSSPERYPRGVAIEVKFQKVGGSVDEKYPFVVLTLKGLGMDSVIFMEGGGYRGKALAWCESQQDVNFRVIEGYTNIMSWVIENL